MAKRILLVDDDPQILQTVPPALQEAGYEVSTSPNGRNALLTIHQSLPDLVIAGTLLPDVDGLELCRRLRSSGETAHVPVLILGAGADVEDKVAAFEAGATDYMTKPLAIEELVARVNAALRRRPGLQGRVIAFLGSKGGVGTTTLVANTAVALRKRTKGRVILADTSVQLGDLGIFLNLTSRRTIADLAPRTGELDAELVSAMLTEHVSGVRVLLGAPWNPAAKMIDPMHLRKILVTLRDMCDYLILDTWPVLERTTVSVLEFSYRVVYVIVPEMASLRNARIFLDAAPSLGCPQERIILALNRYPRRGGIHLREIEKALQRKITVQIPDDDALVTSAANRGVPVVMSSHRSRVAAAINNLALSLMVEAKPSVSRSAPQKAVAPQRKRFFGWL